VNAPLLRLLVAAAGRSVEQGTLVEIVETAARLLSLIRPLLAEADIRGSGEGPATADPPPP
jgi:hypothetical protein